MQSSIQDPRRRAGSYSAGSSASSGLLRYSLTHRAWTRAGILTLNLLAAITGIIGPFYQKFFVDRLMGAPLLVHDAPFLSGLTEFVRTSSPLLPIVIAFLCALLAQGLGLLGGFWAVCEGLILQKEFSNRIYDKMLSIRSDSMGSTTVGEVVSIYATDIPGSSVFVDQVLPMAGSIVFPLVFAPLAIHWLCGFSMTSIVFVMTIVVAFNLMLATRQSRFFLRFKQLAAERTGIVNEWVQNIRLLRILGWVENFETKIFRKREEETLNRVAMVTNGQLMNAFGSSISFVINLIGVASLVYLGGRQVSPGELFAMLWIFGVFLARPFRQIPWTFTFSLDSLTSIRRIEAFLKRPSDAGSPAETSSVRPNPEPQPAEGLAVRGLSLEIRGQKILSDISFDVKAGEFVAIVGEVGSGKTLLILSLVGETGAKFESLQIGNADAKSMSLGQRREHFAFVPQEGFVMSASLRDNIAFRYDQESALDPEVSEALALSQLRIDDESRGDYLIEGLNTEIGERGVNLSGGQRQRVGLARAHYFNRPVVLLDDCLSAVDVDTERQLLKELLDGSWKKKTRILVTHRLSVLSRVDRILFIEDGRITDSGTLSELLARSAQMREFVASVAREEAAKAGHSILESGADGEQKRGEGESKAEVSR